MAHAPSTPRISLVLSIPVVAYSPWDAGARWSDVAGAVRHPRRLDHVGLCQTRRVMDQHRVPYWAVQALKSRVMNMSVLVSLGILTLVFVQRRLDSIRTWPGALL